jgi:hypothetical protein
MATTENVFASNSNQATASTNDCGNGQMPTNIGCQNVDSQIQGDGNSVAYGRAIQLKINRSGSGVDTRYLIVPV